MLCIILLYADGRDSLPTYKLQESSVTAKYYNFRHLFDMNSIIYMKLYRNVPIFLGDARFILASVGGVLPAPAGILVRGGQPWENSIYLNGILLPDPSFKVYVQFPVDVDAINSIEIYRSNIPLDEQILSSVIKINTNKFSRYIKAGFPLISGMWNSKDFGIYADYLYPLTFGRDKFISASALIRAGNVDGFFMHNFLTYKYLEPWDTINYHRVRARYELAGISIKPHRGWNIYYSLRNTMVRTEDDFTTKFWSHFVGIKYSLNERGCEVFYFSKHSDTTMGDETRPRTQRIACFYNFGKLGLRMDILDGKILPSIRFKWKNFLSDNLALKVYLGNAYQNVVYLAFPISEPFIAKSPSMVSTFIIGIEWIRYFPLDINFYVKLYDPYTFGLLMGDNDTGIFAETRQGVDGMDFSITTSNFAISGFIQRSFWWYNVEWGLNLILFDKKNDGAISLFMHQGFPTMIIKEDNYQYKIRRENDVFVVSIQYSISIKKWTVNAGIYNIFQNGEHGPSALYADFIIPIISVRRFF